MVVHADNRPNEIVKMITQVNIPEEIRKLNK